jgi:hypothetical protein
MLVNSIKGGMGDEKDMYSIGNPFALLSSGLPGGLQQ